VENAKQDVKLVACDPWIVATASTRCVISVAIMRLARAVFQLQKRIMKEIVSVRRIQFTHVRARNVDRAIVTVSSVLNVS
jgi:hypothetical protein